MKKSTWILALVWVLVLPASPVYAGHSFSDPFYTTGDGDVYVPGGLDVDGTCQLDGAVTFTSGMTGDNLTLSGTLTVGGAMVLTDSLYIADSLTLTGNLAAGGTLAVTDSTYLADNLTLVGDLAAGGALAVTDSIYAADNLTVADALKVEGALAGARCILPFGSNVSDQTVERFMKGAGYWNFWTDIGYVMARAGSIVGASYMYNIDSYTPTAVITLQIRKNDATVYTLVDTVDATGKRKIYGTQARGTDTFVAGDFLAVVVHVTGTLQYDSYGGVIELQFDD